MVSIPDAATHRREFSGLTLADRRAVLRAVNRGQQVERAKLAGHAVVVARRQRKLWARMPLAGPLVAITQFSLGWEAVVVSALISTLAMAAISRFWWQRAGRAEALNLALTTEGKRRAKAAKRAGAKGAPAPEPSAPPRGLARLRRGGRTDGAAAGRGGSAPASGTGAAPRRSHTPTRADHRD